MIAFYYAWYDMGDWTSGITANGDKPNPTYASSDDAAIDRHIQQADDAGIDALACAWKGPDDQRTTDNCRKLLERIQASGRKIRMTMFADSANAGLFTESEMTRAIGVLQSDFMTSPAYFEVQGKPVFLAWQAERMDIPTWQRIRHNVDPNNDEVWFGGTDQFKFLEVFDTLFYFDITHPTSSKPVVGPTDYMRSYLGRLKPYLGKPFIATVQPGYDDTANPNRPDHHAVPRELNNSPTGFYDATWQFAKDNRACAVVLSTFNEFYEGSYIEPSEKLGTLFLEDTKMRIAEYKSAP